MLLLTNAGRFLKVEVMYAVVVDFSIGTQVALACSSACLFCFTGVFILSPISGLTRALSVLNPDSIVMIVWPRPGLNFTTLSVGVSASFVAFSNVLSACFCYRGRLVLALISLKALFRISRSSMNLSYTSTFSQTVCFSRLL